MPEDDFGKLSGGSPALPIDEKIDSLEDEIAKLKEKRNEDRFCFLTAIIIIVDAYVFMRMPSWGGPVSILFLEIVVLFVVARKLNIQDLTVITDKLIAALGKNGRP